MMRIEKSVGGAVAPGRISTTGNVGLDLLADAIAERVFERLKAEGGERPALFGVKEAAVYLGRSPSAIRNLIGRGVLPCVRQGGRVMLKRVDLDQAIEAQTERV